MFCATKEGLEGRGIGPAMLAALEKRMSPLGLAKLSALMPADRGPVDDFLAQGFEVRTTMRYVERRIPVQREEMNLGTRRGVWRPPCPGASSRARFMCPLMLAHVALM